jgi:hypothetical protein
MVKAPDESKSPVEFIRLEVMEYMERWAMIRSAIDGEYAVKKLREMVLPRPNAADASAQNQSRYDAYIRRAVWYNATSWTLLGMTGFVYMKDPTVELPPELQPMLKNADGQGVTLNQQSKEALRFVLAYGRGGLLVDYPMTEDAVTKAALLNGDIGPSIILYEPEQIINWHVSYQQGKMSLDLLVLREVQAQVAEDDEFALVTQVRYRVLTKTDQGVYGQIYSQNENETFEANPSADYIPTDSAGNPLTEIPFCFIGSVDNSPKIDAPPLLDLALLNLAHFRNSADYEESCFLVGQPTPWASGLTQDWVDNVLKGQIQLGSRGIVPLPQGGSAGILQVEANSMPMEAMKHKEDQMVAIGARLIQPKIVEKTATEVTLDKASEVSILQTCAANVFSAYEKALGFAAQYVGAKADNLEYELSEPLISGSLDSQQALALVQMWQSGLLDYEEARFVLKRDGLAYKDDAVAKKEMTNEGRGPQTVADAAGGGGGAAPAPVGKGAGGNGNTQRTGGKAPVPAGNGK